MFALCYSSQREVVHTPYIVTKKFLCSLGTVRVKLELLMMFDVEIKIMITMCDLMDQFPNFMFRNQTYVIFPPDLLTFSILRFYNVL